MPAPSPAEDAARRLLADADAAPARDPVAVAERATADLAHALGRWFGPYGTEALLTRALAQARRDHAALAAVRLHTPLAPALDGLADAADAHGAQAVTEGVVALLAGAVGLLGRMIGEDMALRLVTFHIESGGPDRPAAGGGAP